jgi:hypothetical protein
MRKVLIDKDVLYRLYIEESKSTSEIGKMLNVDHKTIWRYLQKYNVPIRTLSEARKGKHYPKLSEAKKGKYPSEEARKKMSEAMTGKPHSSKGKHYPKMSEAHKGKHLSLEARRKIGDAERGAKNWNYKGGITPENKNIRKGIELRLWREAVFARDNWTCQKCGKRGEDLQAHHILNFADFPELRTSIENGITLCKNCHDRFHKIYSKKNNTKEQLEEFLKGKLK